MNFAPVWRKKKGEVEKTPTYFTSTPWVNFGNLPQDLGFHPFVSSAA